MRPTATRHGCHAYGILVEFLLSRFIPQRHLFSEAGTPTPKCTGTGPQGTQAPGTQAAARTPSDPATRKFGRWPWKNNGGRSQTSFLRKNDCRKMWNLWKKKQDNPENLENTKSWMLPKLHSGIFAILKKRIRLERSLPKELTRASLVRKSPVFISKFYVFFHMNPGKIRLRNPDLTWCDPDLTCRNPELSGFF